MTSIVRQYSTTKVRRESAADFSSRLHLNVPEITIIAHRPSFVDINSEVSRTRQDSRTSNISIVRRVTGVSNTNITRRVNDVPQYANETNESVSLAANGEENEGSKSITLNADDDVADHVMFESGELNVHLDKITWTNAPWKLSALIFITFEIEQSSQFAKYLGIFLKLVIMLAITGYVVSTVPSLRVYPTVCDFPDCNDDPVLCPGYMICQDETNNEFNMIEAYCTYVFTIEWGLKFLTCWSVTPRVAGILPTTWEEEHEENPDAEQPHYSLPYTMFKWAIQFKNMIDLASIVPFYVQLASANGNQTGFLRVLRLFRIIKILRMLRLLSVLKNVDVAAQIIWATLSQGSLILSVFGFFIIIFVLFFGCIIYLAEQGIWTVDEKFPNGEYLRINKDLTEMEISPFTDIFTGCFWVIGTATGDCPLETTTPQGRVIQSLVMIVGVLSLAFPIGVIGSELDRAYRSHYYTLVQKAEERQKRLLGAAKELENPTPRGDSSSNLHSVDNSIRGSASRLKDKLLSTSSRNSSSLSPIQEHSRNCSEDGSNKGIGEKGSGGSGSISNFTKLPPLRNTSTTGVTQPQSQLAPHTTSSTTFTTSSPSRYVPFHPHHLPQFPSLPPGNDSDRRTQGADVNNYTIHQEDIHIHDLQELQRNTLKHVTSTYLTQHDPSDTIEGHTDPSTHTPTTTSISSLFKSGEIINHTNNIITTSNSSNNSQLTDNNNQNNRNLNLNPNTSQPIDMDMTVYVQKLIEHTRIDITHAQQRLESLLWLQTHLKKEEKGLSHPLNTYHEATEQDER